MTAGVLFLNLPEETVDIDTVVPTVTISSPGNRTYGARWQLLAINATDSNGIDIVWYNWNGTNVTYSGPVNINFDEGINVVRAWANDSAGNVGEVTVVFTIDTVFPSLVINTPGNSTYDVATQLLDITAADNGIIDTVWYDWNGTSAVYTGPVNVTFDEGVNVLQAWVNDTAGNVQNASVTFTVDTIAPSVIINGPANMTYDTAQLLLSIAATDNGIIDTVWYDWNGTSAVYTGPVNVTFDEGVNVLQAWAND
ncbi:MAG: hypothetical protein ACXQS8_03135, partial [Candidatus Helarchaeales archaeon]